MLVDELNNKMVESFLEKFKKMNLKEPDKNIVEGFLKFTDIILLLLYILKMEEYN